MPESAQFTGSHLPRVASDRSPVRSRLNAERDLSFAPHERKCSNARFGVREHLARVSRMVPPPPRTAPALRAPYPHRTPQFPVRQFAPGRRGERSSLISGSGVRSLPLQGAEIGAEGDATSGPHGFSGCGEFPAFFPTRAMRSRRSASLSGARHGLAPKRNGQLGHFRAVHRFASAIAILETASPHPRECGCG
jgi:hypothetical protein